ncbi:MAG TPA: clostripain-related cysteine peptidase [Planctomycetota bacterium]|nr:clostripain-related cysteine peptidase [Planctomycetota bacterium]
MHSRVGGRALALAAASFVLGLGGIAGCNPSAGTNGGTSIAAATSGDAGAITPGVRDWTVMAFVNATNNLEPDLVASVKAMETVGSTPNVSIVVEMQTLTLPFSVPRDTQAKRMLMVKNSDPSRITSPALQVLGDVDGTSPTEIASFVSWAKSHFPARHYALILSDHGGGWSGFGRDDANHTTATAAKLAQLATDAGAALGQRFDIFGFDACLNAAIEVQTLLAPVARIGIGHEESVPASWNYSQFLADLVAQPAMDPTTLARAIVSRTAGFVKGVDGDEATEAGNVSFQMSAIDLDQLPAVVSAFGRFTSKNAGNLASLVPALAVARARALSFEKSDPGTNSGMFVDLGDVIAHLAAAVPDPDLTATSAAIAKAVIVQSRAALEQNATGLSIYWPTPDTGYTLNLGPQGNYSSTAFAQATGWDKYLGAYLLATAMLPPGAAPTLTATQAASGTQLSLGIDHANTAAVALDLSYGGTSLGTIDIDPKATSVSFDPSVFVLSDGQSVIAPDWTVIVPGSGIYGAKLAIVGPNVQGSWAVALCQRDPSGSSATLIGLAYVALANDGSQSYVSVPAADLDGAVVMPYVSALDTSGNVTGVFEEKAPVSVSGLSLEKLPLQSGAYTVTLTAYDWAGNASAPATTTVTVP